MTKLTQHFSLEEFTHSQTAARLGISNDLPLELRESAIRTCMGLEKARIILNANSIHISSGYRCKAVNDAVGSKDTSQHLKAEAVDFTCPTFGTPRRVIQSLIDAGLDFDQIILEYNNPTTGGGWVHISFSDKNRNQALIIDRMGTRSFS